MNQAGATDNIIIPIVGMESDHCAAIIDKKLSRISSITAHRVELNNKRAVITSLPGSAAVTEAIAAIRGLGYEVPVVQKNYPVGGMMCASCALSVQHGLERTRGVIYANVNYANASAQVSFFPALTQADTLKDVVTSLGYELLTGDDAGTAMATAEKKRIAALQRNTILAAVFALPVMVIGMWGMALPYAEYIEWLLATPVLVIFGRQFFVGAWKQALHSSANMDTLVALSAGVAYLYSAGMMVMRWVRPNAVQSGHVYFESSAVVIAFILLGRLLEDRAKGKTASAIKKLMGLQPDTVWLQQKDGTVIATPIAQVRTGDRLMIKPGEKIPVDGNVVTGTGYVDESMLTGEPIPVLKSSDAKVYSGTLNQNGSLIIAAEKVGSATLLAQMIATVQQAQGSRAPVQKLVNKIAGIFVPVVMGIAVLSAVVWVVADPQHGYAHGLQALVTVLVIACPCALGLATPTAIMAGIGKGAENGMLIKDAESLELGKKVTTVVLDKTGTITEGHPEVTDIQWLKEDRSGLLLSMEAHSEHPLAAAIVRYLTPKEIAVTTLSHFESITGSGIKAVCDDGTYYAGNTAWMESMHINLPEQLQRSAQQWLTEAKTVIWFADAAQALGVVAIADRIKPTSARAIHELQGMGIEVWMLTGDNATTAQAVAAQAGITHIKAEMLPAAKAAFVQQLQAEGNVVAMVGDGINDSQALAVAAVSIAMGRGSDIAMDVAKMTIISSDLEKIPQALRLSAQTVNVIRQNLFWAFIYNIAGIPIAAGVLYPVNGFLLNPMIAGAAMALSSVSVVSNSLRLRWFKMQERG